MAQNNDNHDDLLLSLGDSVAHAQMFHTAPPSRPLVVHDRIYGQMQFPPIFRIFIDSPHVQRLRDLKQLGSSHYAYPSGTHTRFEHSLGTAHLAMCVLKQLFDNHRDECREGPTLNYKSDEERQKDVWCVGIAGLCHDLGHGPLSHMFGDYVNAVRKRNCSHLKTLYTSWKHEDNSVMMLQDLWAEKRDMISEYNLTEEDLRFIILLIRGLMPGAPWPEDVGRPSWKRFMTDIVANMRSGLDVDKLDYLQRDSMCCFGMPSLPSVQRLFIGALVFTHEGESQICYQNKLDDTIGEVFTTRVKQFRDIYQHRVMKVIDKMTIDALLAADEVFTINCDGEAYRLSECVMTAKTFLLTGDWILNAILQHPDPRLARAQDILHSVRNRRLYTTIGYHRSSSAEEKIAVKEILNAVTSPKVREDISSWEEANGMPAIEVLTRKLSYMSSGMTLNANPLSRIMFYNPRKAVLEPSFFSDTRKRSILFSGILSECTYFVVSRMRMDYIDELGVAFNVVASEKGLSTAVDHGSTPKKDPRRCYNDSSVPLETTSISLLRTPVSKRRRSMSMD